MILEGIDTSHANLVVNTWADFVIAKATDVYRGVPFTDSRFAAHCASVRKMRVPLGAYCFLQPASSGVSIAAQVAYFVKVAMAQNVQGFAIDWEGSTTYADAIHAVSALRYELAKRGSKATAGLYGSAWRFFNAGQGWSWIAKWGTSQWPTLPSGKRAEIWQWQGAPLDRDRYAGDAAHLRALWTGIPIATPTPPTTVTWTLHVAAGAKVHVCEFVNGCVRTQSVVTWGPKASSALCLRPVQRLACSTQRDITVVRVTSGAFKGRIVHLGPGVTVTHS